MPEINDLDLIAAADVSDDDILPIYDNSSPSNNGKGVTRGDLLGGVARDGGDHDFGTSEITELTASSAAIGDLSITGGIEFDEGATLERIFKLADTIVTAGTAAGASETITKTVTGAAVGNHVILSFGGAIANGLITQAWVSAANTVSVRFYNATGGSIAGATYAAKIAVLRFG